MHKCLVRGLLGSAMSVALLAAAHASVVSSLDVISAQNIGSGTLGTVTLTQDGSDTVDVAVALAQGTAFVSTGGPHNAFAFNLDLSTPYTIQIDPTTPPNIFNAPTGPGPAPVNTPYGTFTQAIDCPGCGPGASRAYPGPLDFSVTDVSGININDFMANTLGYYFSADVIGPNAGTGNIASTGPTPVPEPSSFLLLGTALFGLALARQKATKSDKAGISFL